MLNTYIIQLLVLLLDLIPTGGAYVQLNVYVYVFVGVWMFDICPLSIYGAYIQISEKFLFCSIKEK